MEDNHIVPRLNPSLLAKVFSFAGISLSKFTWILLLVGDNLVEFQRHVLLMVENCVLDNLTITNGKYFTKGVMESIGIERHLATAIRQNWVFTFDAIVHNVIVGAFEHLFLITGIDRWAKGLEFRTIRLNVHSTLRGLNLDYLLSQMQGDIGLLATTDSKLYGKSLEILNRTLDNGGTYMDAASRIGRLYGVQLSATQLPDRLRPEWGDMELAVYVSEMITKEEYHPEREVVHVSNRADDDDKRRRRAA